LKKSGLRAKNSGAEGAPEPRLSQIAFEWTFEEKHMKTTLIATALIAVLAPMIVAAEPYDERPAKLEISAAYRDYERRVVDIPMRDGVKLHTVVMVPKGAHDAAMLLTRTPYEAEKMTTVHKSGHLGMSIDAYDSAPDVVIDGGYIRVIQDVRGKYKSEGTYVMNRPFVGSGLNPTKTDHATDTWDTIDWLVKNVPESNGRVGILGISYDGFTTLAALVNPHPALKVAVPMNPMVDGWLGDDWFHNGAFRAYNLPYMWEQVATRDNSVAYEMNEGDTYDHYMRSVSVGALATEHDLDQIGFWQKIKAHQAYDEFWQAQAMDKILGAQPLNVPTMIVHSLWDQEDIYGAPAVYDAMEPKDAENDMVYLTMGPWYHGQQISRAETLGALRWDSDTAKWWRVNVLAPFLAHYLYDRPMDVAPVTSFQSGSKRWQRLDQLPDPEMTELWLHPDMSVGFEPPESAATVDYVSDPHKPVTYEPRPTRPVRYLDGNPWRTWLADDQRTVSARPDVLTFTGPVLTEPLTITGRPIVHLTASTSGTDSDWVVKLIDVYPDQVPGDTGMGGYQFAVGMDIFRGRFREDLSQAKPLQPNKALKYEFALPMADHVFMPGHRIMVQIQSSWFPLYDRNPQKFVPSIMDAEAGDYVKATQKITVGGVEGTYIDLPVIK
jgi:hypothetical protein